MHSIRCNLLLHMESCLLVCLLVMSPAKKLNWSRCADKRPGWCVKGPVSFLNWGPTSSHSTEPITNSFIQLAKLKLTTVDRCSVPNCTYHYAFNYYQSYYNWCRIFWIFDINMHKMWLQKLFSIIIIAILALYLLSLSVCLPQASVVLKWLNRAFWHGSFLQPILHCFVRKFEFVQN